MSHEHKLYFNLQLKIILCFLWQFHIQIGSRTIYAENEDSRFNLEKLQKTNCFHGQNYFYEF